MNDQSLLYSVVLERRHAIVARLAHTKTPVELELARHVQLDTSARQQLIYLFFVQLENIGTRTILENIQICFILPMFLTYYS